MSSDRPSSSSARASSSVSGSPARTAPWQAMLSRTPSSSASPRDASRSSRRRRSAAAATARTGRAASARGTPCTATAPGPKRSSRSPAFASSGAASSMYLLVSGALTVDLEHQGRRLIIGNVPPGGWVGELALIAPGQASARVTTVEDSDMYVLSHDAFVSLRQEHPQAASAILHTLIHTMATRLRTSSARVLHPAGEGSWALGPVDAAQTASNSGLV